MFNIWKIKIRTHGFSTRYAQEYLDFNILWKQIKYKYKRDEQAKKLFEEVKDSEFIKNALVLNTPMPISLKEAYYEYHYGIFSDAYLKKTTKFLKRAKRNKSKNFLYVQQHNHYFLYV